MWSWRIALCRWSNEEHAAEKKNNEIPKATSREKYIHTQETVCSLKHFSMCLALCVNHSHLSVYVSSICSEIDLAECCFCNTFLPSLFIRWNILLKSKWGTEKHKHFIMLRLHEHTVLCYSLVLCLVCTRCLQNGAILAQHITAGITTVYIYMCICYYRVFDTFFTCCWIFFSHLTSCLSRFRFVCYFWRFVC